MSASEPAPRLELRGARIKLRTPEPSDVAALRAIRRTPEVSAWWGRADAGDPLAEEAGVIPLAVLEENRAVGFIQFVEEADPDCRYAAFDLFIDPRRHRQGIAGEALGTLIDYLATERGHHRFTIDPAVDNAPAIACYEKAGFTRVGVLRSAWRDTSSGRWRDSLLMELVRL